MEASGKLYYSISEVCDMTGLKPHVLRYWESAFPMLTPSKNQSGNRVYRSEDILLIRQISKLLYEERYTIDGARQKLQETMDPSDQMELELDESGAARETIGELKREIAEIIRILERDPMAVDERQGTG
jgi:DNA-binding transcriptional MerR regulator